MITTAIDFFKSIFDFKNRKKNYAQIEKENFRINSKNRLVTRIEGGRSSTNPLVNAFSDRTTSQSQFFKESDLKTLQCLAIWHRHLSYAVENIVDLGNNRSSISFGDFIPDSQQREMKDVLESKQKCWYGFNEGERSLDGDRFAQIATFGCYSTEAEIRDDLKGIKQIHLVNPCDINFAYDSDRKIWVPIQRANKTLGRWSGFRELNEIQYGYGAIRRLTDSPVGIPPFLSALEDIEIESDMIGNFKALMQKLGMLGFMNVLVEMPDQEDQESDDAFKDRAMKFLREQQKEVEQSLHSGFAIGYKDIHEFKISGSVESASNAKELLDMNNNNQFSGLKQDPTMFGKNVNRTETIGRVFLAKMQSQVGKFQEKVAEDKVKKAELELWLNGFRGKVVEGSPVPDYGIKYEFEAPLIGDQKKKAETLKMNTETYDNWYKQGVINQNDRARLLSNDTGRNTPDQQEPRLSSDSNSSAIDKDGDGHTNTTPNNDASNSLFSKNIRSSIFEIRQNRKGFAYNCPNESCAHNFDFTNFRDSNLNEINKKYIKTIGDKFGKAVRKSLFRSKTNLSNAGTQSTHALASEMILSELLLGWRDNFINEITEDIEKFVFEMYDFFRRDKSIFDNIDTENNTQSKFNDFVPPDPAFGLHDARAIEFINSLDELFLGQFITDDDTTERIKNWIRDEILTGNNPVGASEATISQFLNDLSDFIELEGWKIRRIIDTTTTTIRNVANLNYMDQAGITKYEIVEVLDKKTCNWCRVMNGKVFSVKKLVSSNASMFRQGVNNLDSTFSTSIKIEDFEQFSDKEIEDSSINMNVGHPHCRRRFIAIL